jgi:hypothetical protein
MNLSHAVLKVLSHHIGQKNRIGRDRLRSEVMGQLSRGERNISDRVMRQTIEELRRTDDQGALICSSSGGGGYWLAQDLDELLLSYREERRRAINILVTIRARLNRGRRVLSGQRKLL